MRRLQYMLMVLAVSFVLGGCIPTSEGTADPTTTGLNYYYDEFSDVAIPKEMKVVPKKTFLTYSADGAKLGTQEFSGPVELGSLVTAMQSYMLRDGWTLRSVFRSHRSILIFERPDRMCSLYVDDGTFQTTMLVFVSPKLNDGALQYSVPSASSTSAPKAKGSDVTVYPAEPLPQ